MVTSVAMIMWRDTLTKLNHIDDQLRSMNRRVENRRKNNAAVKIGRSSGYRRRGIMRMTLLILLPILAGCMELSGTTEYRDCREQIYLEANSLLKLFKTYVCQRIPGAGEVCVSKTFEGGQCVRAYIYFK
jgi:hypothetical protein